MRGEKREKISFHSRFVRLLPSKIAKKPLNRPEEMYFKYIDLVKRTLGRLVRKPVNVNPGLNVNWGIIFSG